MDPLTGSNSKELKSWWGAHPIIVAATKRRAECFVTDMQEIGPGGLQRGQLWKLEYGYVHIVESDNRHVHYRMLRQLHQRPGATRLIDIDALLNYLHQSQAELVGTHGSACNAEGDIIPDNDETNDLDLRGPAG